MWVCNCKAVTDHQIRELLESPFINTVEDVGKACGAGTGCGGCRGDIAKLCAEAQATARSDEVVAVSVPVNVRHRVTAAAQPAGRIAG